MTKIFKTAGLILSLFILVAIVAIGILVTVISPNKFKPMIVEQVFKHTGRQLVIDGDVSWTFFPAVGLKVGHMVLNNPAGFKEKIFAEIDQATVGVKLLPLLHSKIESTGAALQGLKLNLIKNADGKTNWQDLQVPSAPVSDATTMTVTSKTTVVSTTKKDASPDAPEVVTKEESSSQKVDFSLDIPRLDVSDSQVTWTDEKAKQAVVISHFEIHAKDISLSHSFAISTTFNFDAQNPTVTGDVSLDGNISLDLNKERYVVEGLKVSIKTHQNNKNIATDFTGSLAADMPQQTISFKNFKSHITNIPGIKDAVDVTGQVMVNLDQQTVTLTQFGAQVANLALSGKVNITGLNTVPEAKGHLQAAPFDLKKLLQTIGQDTPVLDVAKMVTADFDFTASGTKTALPIQAVTLQGKVKVEQLQAAKLKASNLNIQMRLQNGILEFVPVTASLYQGALVSQMKITLTSSTPQVSAQAKLTNVQAEPLLQDLGSQGSKIKLKGATNIDLQITTAGTNADVVLRNLNGTSSVSFQKGQLTGINIGNMIDSAYAFLKRQPAPSGSEDVTNFGDLTATGVIRNGVITNNDLSVTGPRFDTKGQGIIDLVNQKIKYQLQITAKNIGQNHNDQDALNIYNYSIPVSITGDLSSPSIHLDTQAIAQEVAKQQIKQVQTKVQDKIRDQIKDKVSGQAGALLQNLLGH
jgi:AsmA protein